MNRTGITNQAAGSGTQILAVQDVQVSFGYKIPVAGDNVIEAGTPVTVNKFDPAVNATIGGANVNGVLLHDVQANKDASFGNGTVLEFGWVNYNRVSAAVQALLTTEVIETLAAAGVNVVKR